MAFGAYYTNKSYYHRFTTINFAKPSWRAYTSMIPFIPNLAESGGSHRDNHHFQRMIARKERTAPQHTRSILPPIHPTKSIAALRGRYFSLWETYLENFMSRPDVIPTFRQRRCTNRGRNFVRSKRWPHYMSRTTSTCFLRLNNSETFVENAFWAQR